MSKVLELVFKDTDGKKKTFSINDPKNDVTKASAEGVMQGIINANIFATAAGDLASIVETRVRTTTVETLE